ncbi:acyltransferase domain-containing protein [Cohnella sp. 56]|uniref:acyltransferase domain-containing protein n=1 Tax=Cohnella sp. 56 TaxID=3113722 RepID=UPI0030EABDFF
MDTLALCEAIGLAPEATAIVRQYEEREGHAYRTYKTAFWQDREAMLTAVRERADYRQLLLYLFARFAADAHEAYCVRGISDDIFVDTFSDIRIWSEVCKQQYGEYGIEESGWLQEHVRLALFRLGRLQFQPWALDRDITANGRRYTKDQIVLNVHIPAGEPLDPEAAAASFAQARAFFRGVPPVFVCASWLLYPGLGELLPPDSNIMRFQRGFHIYAADDAARQAEERIFGCLRDDPAEYETRTGLQRRAQAYLAGGGKLGMGSGIYAIEEEGAG